MQVPPQSPSYSPVPSRAAAVAAPGQRQTLEFPPAPTPGSWLSGWTGLGWTSGLVNLFPRNLGHFLLSCRHGSLIWAWRAGPDLQPDMDPGGMPALDLCPLHEGPEGPTLALGGGGGSVTKPSERREVVLIRLDPCHARVTRG